MEVITVNTTGSVIQDLDWNCVGFVMETLWMGLVSGFFKGERMWLTKTVLPYIYCILLKDRIKAFYEVTQASNGNDHKTY